MAEITREAALGLLRKYNKEEFHLLHALTVEAVMRWYANDLGYAAEADHWALVGLLHDVDFEQFPDQHCKKAPELLREIDADESFINSVCSHGYGPCSDIKPEHLMEKVLFAADELTGLIWAFVAKQHLLPSKPRCLCWKVCREATWRWLPPGSQ